MSEQPLGRLFSANGPLAELLPGFRPRAGQLELAETIAHSLNTGQDLIAEAATGTGKTLAYLVPLILRDERSIVSTGTLNLQDQLFHRDLPLALRAVGVERKTALLKGRSNYLCLHRLERHLDDAGLDADTLQKLRLIKRWANATGSGEISEVDAIPSSSPVWPLATSTQDNCLGTECPFYSDCHLVKARRRAQDADIVVVNHHLLFADMALKQSGFGEVLPGAETVIIDEAHQVPDTAMRFFSRGLSAWQLRELARDALAACGGAPGSLKLLREPIDTLRAASEQAQSECLDLPPRGEFAALARLRPVLQNLLRALQAMVRALDPIAEQTRDLANCAARAVLLHDGLDDFLKGPDGYVRWYTQRRGRFQFNLTPLDVAAPLNELRQRVPATWVMTSATLAVNGSFEHFTRPLGLEEASELVVDSPFDYPNQTRLWIPPGLPHPSDPAHIDRLLAAVHPVLLAAGGRAFLLFTSHRALRRAAEWLRAQSNFHLCIQEEAPRQVLLERFRTTPGSLLLGAASFWEGVDVPGRELSLVVIDKLPFAAPDDPVLEATLRAVRDAGENPFTKVQLPQAVLALKQGAGRLIRQAGDSGVLILGDPRLLSKTYGRMFLASLPPMPRLDSGAEVASFLRERLAT